MKRQLVGYAFAALAAFVIFDPFPIRARATTGPVFAFNSLAESGNGSTHGVGGNLILQYSSGMNQEITRQVLSTGGTTVSGTTGQTNSTTSSTSSSTTSTTGTQTTYLYYVVIANNASSPASLTCSNDSLGDHPTYASTHVGAAYPSGWGSPAGYWTYYLGSQVGGGTPPSMGDSIPVNWLFGASGSSANVNIQALIYITGGATNYSQWQEVDLNKGTAVAQSVDSRRMYGVANSQGEIAGVDPNAPQRNQVFSSWFYKGGLFTGHAQTGLGDQSGVSRLQAYITPNSGTSFCSCFTLYYLGTPTNMGANYTLEAYMPNSTDINLNQALASLDWSNAWAIPTASGNQLGSVAMPPALFNQGYMSFNITSDNLLTSSNQTPLLLAMNPEPTLPTDPPNTWSYYASSTYASTYPGASDQGPRAWFAIEGRHSP